MGAANEVINPPGSFKQMSESARLLLAWAGVALVVFVPLLSPLLFTSAHGFWSTFWLLLAAGGVLWLVGLNITYRRPNSFFFFAAIVTVLMGAINLGVANTHYRAVLLDRYRYDADPAAHVSEDLLFENAWILIATVLFVLLFLLLQLSMGRTRRKQKRRATRPRYRAEFA